MPGSREASRSTPGGSFVLLRWCSGKEHTGKHLSRACLGGLGRSDGSHHGRGHRQPDQLSSCHPSGLQRAAAQAWPCSSLGSSSSLGSGSIRGRRCCRRRRAADRQLGCSGTCCHCCRLCGCWGWGALGSGWLCGRLWLGSRLLDSSFGCRCRLVHSALGGGKGEASRCRSLRASGHFVSELERLGRCLDRLCSGRGLLDRRLSSGLFSRRLGSGRGLLGRRLGLDGWGRCLRLGCADGCCLYLPRLLLCKQLLQEGALSCSPGRSGIGGADVSGQQNCGQSSSCHGLEGIEPVVPAGSGAV